MSQPKKCNVTAQKMQCHSPKNAMSQPKNMQCHSLDEETHPKNAGEDDGNNEAVDGNSFTENDRNQILCLDARSAHSTAYDTHSSSVNAPAIKIGGYLLDLPNIFKVVPIGRQNK